MAGKAINELGIIEWNLACLERHEVMALFSKSDHCFSVYSCAMPKGGKWELSWSDFLG